MRTLIRKGETESARSAYYFAEHKFAYLGQIVVRACKDFGVDPQPVHEFLDYRDADPMSAIRAVGLLEWRLKGELTQEATANPEHKDTEPEEPPAENPQPSKVAAGDGAPTPADQVSPDADERPDDLIILKVVRKGWQVSESTLYRDIKSGKLKTWRKAGNRKHRVSEAAVKKSYVPWPT